MRRQCSLILRSWNTFWLSTKRAGSLIAILEDVQDQFRFLPEEALVLIGSSIGVSASQVYGVATFYNAFSLIPKGHHVVSVCLGTACHVRGAGDIFAHVRKQMNTDSSGTTPDFEFTIEEVRCLGCCSIAPVLKVDDEVYGHTDPNKALNILEGYRAEKDTGT